MPTSLPYRQLSRLSTEFGASTSEAVLKLFPGRYAEGLMFLLAARVCVPDWIDGAAIRAPSQINHFISVNAMASSLYRPAETARRHARFLIDSGLLIRTQRGLAVSSAPEYAPRVIAFYRLYHDLMIRYIADAHATCDLTWPRPGTDPSPTSTVMLRSLDVSLLPLALYSPVASNWLMILLWSMINTANIRHITYDPILSKIYSIDSTPDELRRPVSLRAIAATLDIPYATAWRQVRRLEAQGLIAWRADGLVVLSHQLRDGPVDTIVNTAATYTVRAFREIVAGGVDQARAADFYLDSRPPLMSLSRAGCR